MYHHPPTDHPRIRLRTFKEKLVNAYNQLRIGDPLDQNNHVGPLIDKDAVNNIWKQLRNVKKKAESLLLKAVYWKVKDMKAAVM